MNEVIKITRDQRTYKVPLGRRGENKATVQPFDISYFVEEFGDGRAELVHRPPYENTYYPVPIERDGSIVTWTVLACDTAKQGSGDAEIRWFVPNEDGDDVLAISTTMKTIILSSMSGEEGEKPDGLESWINEITKRVTAAIDAMGDAVSDDRIAELVNDYLERNPPESGTDENAVITIVGRYITEHLEELKGDKGDTGEKGEPFRYEDFTTEQLAALKGEKGDTGEPGERGADGQKGDKGDPGEVTIVENPYDDSEIRDAISRQSESIVKKLDKPETGAEVGKILAVKAVNEDGTMIVEWIDAPSGGVADVIVSGESIVDENGNAVIPSATSGFLGGGKKGIVTFRDTYGISVDSYGIARLYNVPLAQIEERNTTIKSCAVTFYNYETAIRTALCDGKGAEWTAEEKANAQIRMGILSVEGVGF